MRRLATAILMVFSLSAFGGSGAYAECAGVVENVTIREGHKFKTTSRVYRAGRVHVYETCVENLKPGKDLDFHWYIPGPHSWVPAGETVNSPRRRVTRRTLNGHEGCLRFGNQWNPYSSDFLPHAGDISALEHEQRIGCKKRIEQEAAGGEDHTSVYGVVDELFSIAAVYQVFAPSNKQNPSETMVRITAYASLSAPDEGTYRHSVGIAMEPLGDEASMDKLTIVPDVQDLRKAFFVLEYGTLEKLKAAMEENPPYADLKQPEKPTLQDVLYRLFDENEEHVATLFIPIWVEANGEG